MSNPGPNPTALIVGRGPASAQAALDIASAGVPVTLLTPDEGLIPGTGGLLDMPLLLEVARHPQVNLLTGATVKTIRNARTDLRVTVHQAPRYVDPARCTACGACAEACPVLTPSRNDLAHLAPQALPGELKVSDTSHKAIYRGGVPTSFAIDKIGTSPCRHACPIHQRAQGYVALVGAGNFEAAYHTIKRDNPFPSVCGRVCNHRCEDVCSRAKVDAPVNIMALKRFVTDWMGSAVGDQPSAVSDGGTEPEGDKPEPTGKKVAVVGSGPAGLTCALDLVRQGHAVTVFEALAVAGGMMRVGVPAYRLPYELVEREIDDILAKGVELVLNHRVDDVPRLLEQGYDAVFVAVGAHTGVKLPIPGADLPEVLVATEFLREISLRGGDWGLDTGDSANSQYLISNPLTNKRVLVLGGGNVAVDAAMGAVRLGSSWVGMSCLESREAMPAHDWEVRDAAEEGIKVFPSRTFKEVTGDEGRVTGVRCAEIDFRGFKDGRPDFDELPGTEAVIEADVVIFAIGQRPEIECLLDKVETVRGRFPAVDPETLATSVPGIFAGGDVVTGTAFIVDAIAAGHKAARSIDRILRGLELTVDANAALLPPVELDEAEVQSRLATGQAASAGRVETKKRLAAERRKDFGEVYAGLTAAEAQAEAARCLSCGVCSECLQCEEICPAGAISHEKRPQTWELSANVVLWAEGQPEIKDQRWEIGDRGIFVAGNGTNLTDAVDRALSHLGFVRSTPLVDIAAPSHWQLGPRTAQYTIPLRDTRRPYGIRNTQLGVFLCRCGGEIEQVVDLSAVAARAEGLPGVTFVDQIDFACHPRGNGAIRSAWANHNLDGAVLAACSCCALDQICYSCTTQRIRCKERLRVWDGLKGLPFEFVNVREQCAFAHTHNPVAATLKAGDLVAASIGALLTASDQSPSPTLQHLHLRQSEAQVQVSLTSNPQSPIPITAVVDPVRCRGCEDCELICGLQAMHVIGINGTRIAHVDASLCLGCGVCMAVCSSGAILASDASDAQVEAKLAAMGDLSDKTVVFSCNWGAYSAVEAAGTAPQGRFAERLSYDPSVRLVRLMCAGRAHEGLIMRAFAQGAARVLVLTCGHEGDSSLSPRETSQCRYHTGNDQAGRAVEQARQLLELLGVDPARLAIAEMRPGDGAGFVAAVEGFVEATTELAPEGRM